MDETGEDMTALQDVLDRSMEEAGPHLLEVLTPERTLDAENLCARLTGMRLLALATVTSDNRPLVGPVDGIFYRGSVPLRFGSDLGSGPTYPPAPAGQRHPPSR